MSNPFSSLGLGTELVSALTAQGYENPTPIKPPPFPKHSWGHDLLAAAQNRHRQNRRLYAAQSGTPQTLRHRQHLARDARCVCSSLPPRANLPTKSTKTCSPTSKTCRFATVLFGGMNVDKQTADLPCCGCEIVVATVGRLLDHVKQKNIQFEQSRNRRWTKQTACWIWGLSTTSAKSCRCCPNNAKPCSFPLPSPHRYANWHKTS